MLLSRHREAALAANRQEQRALALAMTAKKAIGGLPWVQDTALLSTSQRLNCFSGLCKGGEEMSDESQQPLSPAETQSAGGLTTESTADPESPIVDLFFEHYDRAFVLPHEKESLQGFRDCLALNRGQSHERLRERYGPFREAVLIAREPGGEIAGGANFIAFPLPANPPAFAINLNYIFIVPAWRRLGYFPLLLGAVRQAAAAMFPGASLPLPPVIFFEQNDPMRLTQADYARDNAHAGLDQFQRIAIWAKAGARIADFPYVQPPLSPAQAPDTALCLGAIGVRGSTLDPSLLREHLLRFFAISVLKGRDPGSDPAAKSQLAELAQACLEHRPIPLLDTGALSADALRRRRSASSKKGVQSLRDALRNPVI